MEDAWQHFSEPQQAELRQRVSFVPPSYSCSYPWQFHYTAYSDHQDIKCPGCGFTACRVLVAGHVERCLTRPSASRLRANRQVFGQTASPTPSQTTPTSSPRLVSQTLPKPSAQAFCEAMTAPPKRSEPPSPSVPGLCVLDCKPKCRNSKNGVSDQPWS
jgi:hypothetical protein